MYITASHFSLSTCRSRRLAGLLLVALLTSSLPVVSRAQQPTATITTVTGTVLVSGQAATVGTVLRAGDAIQTGDGATVVLALSDGSTIQLGANTQVNFADLTQTATGARTSFLKLTYGRLRALLSPGHQQAGSAFTIETPNAQIGVKFSQPDVEVSYDPAKQETVGIAHTVALLAKNLLTGETMTIPVGSTVIIVGLVMKIVAGTTASTLTLVASTPAASTAATTGAAVGAAAVGGVSAATIVAVGAGVAVTAGTVAIVAANSGDEEQTNNPFTGTFVGETFNSDDNATWINAMTCNLIQNGSSVTGTFRLVVRVLTGTRVADDWTQSITGTVAGTSVMLSGVGEGGTMNCTLVDTGHILRCPLPPDGVQVDFIRQ